MLNVYVQKATYVLVVWLLHVTKNIKSALDDSRWDGPLPPPGVDQDTGDTCMPHTCIQQTRGLHGSKKSHPNSYKSEI